MNIANLNFKNWINCSEKEKGFFCGHEYLPFHSNESDRIAVLTGPEARELRKKAFCQIPEYLVGNVEKRKGTTVLLSEVWGNEEEIQKIREWLYNTGVPFSETVYLLYDNQVVKTEWKILVKFWDAFAWNVGVAMVATDFSGMWACEFHHEDAITFYQYEKNT